MTEPLDPDLLALASCPPPTGETIEYPPIDMAEERITIQQEALNGPVTYIINLCCEELVAIGATLTKIERHLKRLVNKELKGTGVALAQIANFLQVIALTNIGENNVLIQQLFSQQLFAPPLSTDSPPSEAPEGLEPFAQAPETAPAVEALLPGEGPFGIISPPEEELIPPPVPQFEPETSTAVGGPTIPLALPRGQEPSEIGAFEDKGTWEIPDEVFLPSPE